jgi:5-methylcytosine-specific restriction endonuclease McrA
LAPSPRKKLLIAVARTDRTFEQFDSDRGPLWRGKCLICNGFLEFHENAAVDREATVEHILARSNGGHPTAIENLAVVHPGCNSEKGRRTDVLGVGHPKHQKVVERMLQQRRRRWREERPE